MMIPITRISLAASVLATTANAALIAGFDQRYASGDYNSGTGTWTDSVGSANAVANNIPAFTATTTPNGSDAVANTTSAVFMNFTRGSALGSSGTATIQAVIRIDGTVDDRSGPYALAQTSGWGGLFMGAQTDGVNDIRGGNVGNTGSSNGVLRVDNGGASVTTGTWGVYTMVIDATQNSTPQLTATFALLSDLSNVFSVSASATSGGTAATLGLGNAGVLFGGERGNAATNNTTGGWNGAIADVVVYNSALSSTDVSANLTEFRTLYQIPEPGSATLLGLTLGLGLLRRKRA